MRRFFPDNGFYTLDYQDAKRKFEQKQSLKMGRTTDSTLKCPQERQYEYLLKIFSSLEVLMTELQQCLDEFKDLLKLGYQIPEGVAIDQDSVNLWQSIQDEQFQNLEEIREKNDIDRLIAEQEEKMVDQK